MNMVYKTNIMLANLFLELHIKNKHVMPSCVVDLAGML